MIFADSLASVTEFTRLYLAVFYSFVAVFYTSRIFWLKRVVAGELIFPGQRFCATWWNHVAFRVFRVLIWMVCLWRFVFPALDAYLGTISILQRPVIIALGLTLLTLGFTVTLMIHCKMGQRWRSGIDPRGPDALITHGIYRYSRNPMFLSVAVSQLGFFLALPSVFSLLCLGIGLYTLRRQILSEENHLAKKFPEPYQLYTTRVRRWI